LNLISTLAIVLALEITEDLEAALAQFAEVEAITA